MKQAKTLEAVTHTHTHTHTHTQVFYRNKNVLANYTLEISGVSFCTAFFDDLISKTQDSFVKYAVFA